MVIKENSWIPDTCECELKYTWDDAVPQTERTHTISFVNKSCTAHRNLLPNTVVTYSCVLDENQKKNKTLQTALENAPQQLADIFTNETDGTQYYTLKNNITFSFTFSGTAPNRVLTVEFIGSSLNSNQKSSIQNKLNQIFGTGVVIIV